MRWFQLVGSFVLCAVAACGQPACKQLSARTEKKIRVNYPSRTGERFVNLTLYGFQQYTYDVDDHGAAIQVVGFSLERFLWAAGWDYTHNAERYTVQVDGIGGKRATFPMPEIQPGFLDKIVVLVMDRNCQALSYAETPTLVVAVDGVVTKTVRGVWRINVVEKAD